MFYFCPFLLELEQHLAVLQAWRLLVVAEAIALSNLSACRNPFFMLDADFLIGVSTGKMRLILPGDTNL